MVATQLVLRRARQRHVGLEVPDGTVGVEGRAGGFLRVLGHAPAALFLDVLDELDVHAVGGFHPAGGIGEADHGRAELLRLLHGVDGHVAGAGDDNLRAVDGVAVGLHHLVGEVHAAVAGGLLTHQGAAPGQALAGEHSGLVLIHQAAVLAEQVADLAAADTDVAGGHVAVLADVAPQLRHEGLAKAHDLAVGAALRVEVGAALAAADRQAGQGVFEDLLEAEELNDAQVHARVEAQPALVGAERGVELDAEAAVDAHIVVVVQPGHTEDDLALRLAETLDQAVVRVMRVLAQHDLQRIQHLGHRLVELRLARVALQKLLVVAGNFLINRAHWAWPPISIAMQNYVPDKHYNTIRPRVSDS